MILSTIIKKIEHNYDAFLFSHLCILQKQMHFQFGLARERARTKKAYSWNIAGDSDVEMTGY